LSSQPGESEGAVAGLKVEMLKKKSRDAQKDAPPPESMELRGVCGVWLPEDQSAFFGADVGRAK
jgi:hypothetical protein